MEKVESRADPASHDEASPVADRILGAAFSAFIERGYSGASTLEIATRARVSKRELYALFGSKQAILRACIAARARRFQPPQASPTPTDPPALLAALRDLGAHILLEVTHPIVVGVQRLAVAEAGRSPDVGEALEDVQANIRAGVADLLARSAAMNLIDAEAGADAMARDFLALLFGDLMVRLLQGRAVQPSAAEAQRQAQAAAAAVLKLYAPNSGPPDQVSTKARSST